MSLQTYKARRNFRLTPEPAGKVGKRKSGGLSFVIQKHAASRLHYDFRLEMDGVLLSWAVPKGPSLDPNDKRLAMHVEDHPMEYGDFEGIIPPKQYGAGTVLLWDRGTWTPTEDPHAGYKKGKLKFELDGDKLQGGWTLVKSRSSNYGENAWLLIKEDDEHAVPAADASVVEDKPRSVSTGRSLDEIKAEKSRVWESTKSVADNVKAQKQAAKRKPGKTAAKPSLRLRLTAADFKGAAKSALPAFIKPQLAKLVDAVPASGDWVQEIKYDGYRMLCRIDGGKARMFSRNGKDWTREFQAVADAAARLPADKAWVDGELVVMDAKGRSSFQALQNALSSGDPARRSGNMLFVAFDLPFADGHDLRNLPLTQRKAALEKLMADAPEGLRYGSHMEIAGGDFLEQACKLGLEGVVAKSAKSGYSGTRNGAWLKIKCSQRQEMVIGGYTDPQGSRSAFGALLLGVYEDGKLRYSGKVGTGFDEATLQSLYGKLQPLEQHQPAFSNPPKGAEARRSHWVKPHLVAEISFTEWTHDGTLRHPVFQGLREDKKPAQVVRERPSYESGEQTDEGPLAKGRTKANRATKAGKASKAASTPPGKAATRTGRGAGKAAGRAATEVKLTHPDKLLFPDAGISKKDLVAFYTAIGDWLLPHLKNRPLSLVRCPDGWQKGCFFQKNADASNDVSLERVEVQTSDGPAHYMMANSLRALHALVQMGVLEIHPWGSTQPKLSQPDRIIFDFDPDDGMPWTTLVEAVTLLRTLLEELGLQSFVKTTGGKGLHCVVPIRPTHDWDTVKAFSKAVAELMVRTFPGRFTAKVSKASRKGRIFIDYLRNGEGATAIAAYAVRARANAPVAVPIAWEDLQSNKRSDLRFDHFNVKNLPALLKRRRNDPWSEFFTLRQSLTTAALKRLNVPR